MLTGRPPFQAASPVETLLLVLEQDPVPPRVLIRGSVRDLEMITLRCLQKQPDLRYGSAAALADDLEAFLRDEPVSARSTSLRALAGRLLGETHHAGVLENWGQLWIYHSVALLFFFGATNVLLWPESRHGGPTCCSSPSGLGAWAALFWALRRQGGPISFVERQLAHVWGSGIVAINLVFLVEWLLGLPVLSLITMIAVTNGMLFMVKAGILSGFYYFQAAAVILAILPMAMVSPLRAFDFRDSRRRLLLRHRFEVQAAAPARRALSASTSWEIPTCPLSLLLVQDRLSSAENRRAKDGSGNEIDGREGRVEPAQSVRQRDSHHRTGERERATVSRTAGDPAGRDPFHGRNPNRSVGSGPRAVFAIPRSSAEAERRN